MSCVTFNYHKEVTLRLRLRVTSFIVRTTRKNCPYFTLRPFFLVVLFMELRNYHTKADVMMDVYHRR
ncbi:hypothetical protein J2X61_002110 [Bacillus sp. 3255]|nr:hypothetical protein [Bacillus sp. 3255]